MRDEGGMRMSLQDYLDCIEELLRERKDTDPGARGAWLAVTVPCNHVRDFPEWVETVDDLYMAHHVRHPDNCKACQGTLRLGRGISDWPKGAVQGLLFQIAEEMGVAVLCAHTLAPQSPNEAEVLCWLILWEAPSEALAAALIEALKLES